MDQPRSSDGDSSAPGEPVAGLVRAQTAADPWNALRRFTPARIALGRAGGSVPTRHQLAFRLDHARARVAVWSPFDAEELAQQLKTLGHATLLVRSRARDRAEFLQRPDLGRCLDGESRSLLEKTARRGAGHDLVIILSDGLSTLAAATQSVPLVQALTGLLNRDRWSVAPIVVARHGRVALQDEIGEIFRARLSLMLLGERPGLGSADSLGAYFTFDPKVGRHDADRNCVSNIRSGGIPPEAAAQKIHYLLTASRNLGMSGVRLKDDFLPVSVVDQAAQLAAGTSAEPGAAKPPKRLA
ncbi:MAG TPA: ethanolamine ammonia-lyase subunit EutC [Chthoniobacterales bacterium]